MAVQKVELFILFLGSMCDIVMRASDEHLSKSLGSTSRTSLSAILSRVNVRICWEECSQSVFLHLLREAS